MAKITHPEMRRGKDAPVSNRPVPETYVVDDMTDEGEDQLDSLDKKIAEFESSGEKFVKEQPIVQQAVPQQKKLESSKPNKVLEQLIFMGRYSKEVEIAGHKFELSTLTHRENNEIVRRLMNAGEAADLFTIRILTLAGALRKIDGVSIDEFDINEEFEDITEKRIAIIDNMQVALVEKLHAAYEAMVKESEQVVFGESIKN